jgi:Secretion system C-terminal sorting domain
MVRDSMGWSGITCAPIGYDGISIYSLTIFGPDTKIDGKIYQGLWAPSDTAFSSYYNAWFIREDSLGQVFLKGPTNFFDEELLYHFGANEGDTVFTYYHKFNYGNLYVIGSTDSVLYGKTRRVITLKTEPWYQDTIVWIEGLGSFIKENTGNPNLGPDLVYQGLAPQTVVDCGQAFGFCHWEGDSLVYSNNKWPSYGECFPWELGYYVGLDKGTSKRGFSIYPQPADKKVFIHQKEKTEIFQVSLYNLRGKELFSYFLGPNRNEIDVRGLPAGLYIIKSEDGKVYSKLLIAH